MKQLENPQPGDRAIYRHHQLDDDPCNGHTVVVQGRPWSFAPEFIEIICEEGCSDEYGYGAAMESELYELSNQTDNN